MSTYEKAISFDELHQGLKKSKRNVAWKDSVASYAGNGLRNTYKLRRELLEGSYQISEYQRFKIHEPKERGIVATRIRDRQLQRSLCDNVLYDALTRGFIRDNVACQRGRGVDDALDRMETHLHRYFRKHGADGWVLKCDIHHYFAETPHEVAKAAICKRVHDKQAAQRACEIVDSFGGDRGIGLGSQVSQLVELAVLDDMDHRIKEQLRVKHYIRYMDDFVLIHEDRAFLEHCLKLIREELAAIGLQLNAKTQIHPLRQGVKFLNWRFILTDTGKVVRRMSSKSIRKERRKLAKLKNLADDPRSPVTYKDLELNFQSFRANAERGDTHGIVLQMSHFYNDLIMEGKLHEHQGKRPAAPGQGRGPRRSRSSPRGADCAAAGGAPGANRGRTGNGYGPGTEI